MVADREFGIDDCLREFWRSVDAQLVTWTWNVAPPPSVRLQCYAHYSVTQRDGDGTCSYTGITGVCPDVPQLLCCSRGGRPVA